MCHRKPFNQTKTLLLILCLILSTGSLRAQHLLFLNPEKGKVVLAKPGDFLSIQYKGYLGQTEYFKSTLTFIDDSTFTLGMPSGKGWFTKKDKPLPFKTIRFDDVTGFRKAGPGRMLLKSTLSMGAAIGSVLLLNNLYTQNEIPDLGKIGISLGVGISVNLLIDALLPEHPKNKMKDGWLLKKVEN